MSGEPDFHFLNMFFKYRPCSWFGVLFFLRGYDSCRATDEDEKSSTEEDVDANAHFFVFRAKLASKLAARVIKARG